MKLKTKLKLIKAWNYCDVEDKSTEFMFQFMADSAEVEYDVAVDFVMDTDTDERLRLIGLLNENS